MTAPDFPMSMPTASLGINKRTTISPVVLRLRTSFVATTVAAATVAVLNEDNEVVAAAAAPTVVVGMQSLSAIRFTISFSTAARAL